MGRRTPLFVKHATDILAHTITVLDTLYIHELVLLRSQSGQDYTSIVVLTMARKLQINVYADLLTTICNLKTLEIHSSLGVSTYLQKQTLYLSLLHPA